MGAAELKSVLTFSPLGKSKYGTSIRSNYLIDGLAKNNALIGSYDIVLFSKYVLRDNARLRSFINMPMLPARIRKSEIIFFEGLPYSPNKLRTKMIFDVVRSAKKRKKRVILDMYDDPQLQAKDIVGEDKNGLFWGKARSFFFENADIVTFPSGTMRDIFTEKGLDPAKAEILPNASDPKHFPYSPPPADKTIGLLTGMAPGRGLEMLMKSFEIVREAHPMSKLVVGTPPSKSHRLDQLQSGNKRVRFVHDVTYESAPAFLSKCTIYAIPHVDKPYLHLATPIKLFDSMASGRPVVTTDCYETAKIVHEENCGLVSTFEPDDFAEKIIRLLQNGPEARRLGQNGRRSVEDKHSWNHRVEKLERIIDSFD